MGSIRDLQRALELAHYAARHRGTLYVAALAEDSAVSDFLLDLKLVGAYGLRGVVVARAHGGTAWQRLAEARQQGIPFAILDGEEEPAEIAAAVREALAGGRIPVVLVRDAHRPRTPGPASASAAVLARELGARRLLILTPDADFLVDGDPKPHFTLEEARAQRDGAEGVRAARWAFLVDVVERGVPGVVVLRGEPGAVFEELFTHHGAGVLVGDELIEEVRPATLADLGDISLLLKGEIERGVVRPVPETELVRTAEEHVVYTIDGLVVGTARLAPYGDEAELSRFATLPRYRGRGRARRLGEALIARARVLGFRHLFALSIDERMWRFFESLGLTPCDRGDLPEAWAQNYDFSRPSRAFRRVL